MSVSLNDRLVPSVRATAPRCRVIGLVIYLAGILSACSRTPEAAQFIGPTMGTTYHVTVTGAESLRERRAVQSAIDRVLAETERHLSTYRATSEIALLNRVARTATVTALGVSMTRRCRNDCE